MAYNVLMFR